MIEPPELIQLPDLTIALVLPRSGSPGIYGPSCRSCAELAVHDINAAGGIDGHRVGTLLVDGAQRPDKVAATLGKLVDAGAVTAVVGMHDSDVRGALVRVIDRRIPYVYAANYEGEDEVSRAYGVGLTAEQQIRNSVAWLSRHRGIRNWSFIGNDYIWPRSIAQVLTDVLSDAGLHLLTSDFVPMGTVQFATSLALVEQTRPDAVFTALVGADAVAFNRQFVRRGLDRNISRFLPLFEENSLLAVGGAIGNGAYTAGAFFADACGDQGRAFRARYEARFGEDAPQLNGFAVSCYEAVMLLSVLLGNGSPREGSMLDHGEASFPGVLGDIRLHRGHAVRDVLLAEAIGDTFAVRATFPALTACGEALG